MNWKRIQFVALLGSALAWTGSFASAQIGVLDQISPTPSGSSSAGFNVDATSLTWQQQVRVGLAGQLEGFELTATGAVGATCDVRVRVGDGWSTGAVVFSGSLVKTTGSTEAFFVDVTSAGLSFAVGDTFVIELQGTGTGLWLRGSYIDPAVGPPLYPENLYLNASSTCYADCGWRHGFRTWMINQTVGTPYCPGDGAFTSCPCANNNDGSMSGCDWQSGGGLPGGALTAMGSNIWGNNDTYLVANNINANFGVFFAAPNALQGLTLGDGLRCVGGGGGIPLVRLIPPTNPGSSTATHAVPLQTLDPYAAPGITRNYQYWFRAPGSFCGTGSNTTNGYTINWM